LLDISHPINQRAYQEKVASGRAGSEKLRVSPENDFFINVSVRSDKGVRETWTYLEDGSGKIIPLKGRGMFHSKTNPRAYSACVRHEPLPGGNYKVVLKARNGKGGLLSDEAFLTVDGALLPEIPYESWVSQERN
jgi:hypothetical protein